jgi:hypothetical protein
MVTQKISDPFGSLPIDMRILGAQTHIDHIVQLLQLLAHCNQHHRDAVQPINTVVI